MIDKNIDLKILVIRYLNTYKSNAILNSLQFDYKLSIFIIFYVEVIKLYVLNYKI